MYLAPSEWAEKRLALDSLRDTDQGEEVSDAQIAEELFYDPDATDDDLGMFLGISDKELKRMYPGSDEQMSKQKGPVKKSFPGVTPGGLGAIKSVFTEKIVSEPAARKSSGAGEAETKRKSSSQLSNASPDTSSDKDIISGPGTSQQSQPAVESTNLPQGEEDVPTMEG